MAHAPMPKLVSIHAPKIGCNQLSMDTLTEILQSESVQRLLNRQNVYLLTPLTDGSVVSDLASPKNSFQERRNGSVDSENNEKIPELSVIPIMNPAEKDSAQVSSDDEHLLPSKNQGKSSVALLPINRGRRDCGHFDPCEKLLCEVEFQRIIENNVVLPLIAENIESDEIDARVFKHCDNEKCDATSIDHDHCRRAIVRCHRTDQSNKCDICMVVLRTRKSQMMHKNCKMRYEYRHNRTSRGKLMKDRMRVRELEILESTRLNRNDYSDPETGHERAMENLQKNSELIVTQKATSLIKQNHSSIRITSVAGGANFASGDMRAKRFPLILPARSLLLGKQGNNENTDKTTKIKQMNLVDGTTVRPIKRNKFISISRTGSLAQSFNPNDFLQSQSQGIATLPNQATSYFKPIRVVPIASLKSEPSLRDQIHGLPKFCIVSQPPNQSTSSSSFSTTPKRILPAQPKTVNRYVVLNSDSSMGKNPSKADDNAAFQLKRFKQGLRRGRRRKNGPKRGSKSFECTFCFKRFSTDWYFKLHIAKHKGEIKFTCEYCNKPFMNLYNMTKHMVAVHNVKEESVENNDEDYANRRYCSNCNLSFKTKIERDSHQCPVVCLLCNLRIADDDLLLHLRTDHEMLDEEAAEEFDRQNKERESVDLNHGENRHDGADEEECGIRVKEEPGEKYEECKNSSTKRKRNYIVSNANNEQNSIKTNVRRRTRRRKRVHVERSESAAAKKKRLETQEESNVELKSHFSCECANGFGTIGCCFHVATIIYYLSHGRYLLEIPRLDETLSKLSDKDNVSPAIEKDSDQD